MARVGTVRFRRCQLGDVQAELVLHTEQLARAMDALTSACGAHCGSRLESIATLRHGTSLERGIHAATIGGDRRGRSLVDREFAGLRGAKRATEAT